MSMQNEGQTPDVKAGDPPPANSAEARNPDGTLKEPVVKPADDKKPEPKVDDKKPDEGKKPEDKKAEDKVVPEKYEFKAPEGQELDAKLIEGVTPLFKELGLSNEQAQKLIDFHTKTAGDSAKALTDAYEAKRTEWRDAVIKDPKLGDGKDNLKPEVMANVTRAIDSLPNAKEFRAAMDFTGAGDNPAVVAMLNHFAQFVTEGKHVSGKGPTDQSKPNGQATPAQRMYPNLPTADA